MKFSQLRRIFLICVGIISLGLGILGAFLPLLPTTPFLLLSAACFVRSSDKLYNWLMGHKLLGPYIQSFREGKELPLKTKLVIIAFVWLSIGFTLFFVMSDWRWRLFMAAGALLWTAVVLLYKPRRRV